VISERNRAYGTICVASFAAGVGEEMDEAIFRLKKMIAEPVDIRHNPTTDLQPAELKYRL